MSSRVSQLKSFWYKDPTCKFNITTKERKELLLNGDLTIIFQGNLYEIKFKNLGGGVWQMFTEKFKK